MLQINLFPLGAPTGVSEDKLAKASRAASAAANALKAKHSSNFATRMIASSLADPDEGNDSEDDSAELELWRLLPQLKDLPESFLKKLPMSAMFQLNTALSKEKKTAEKLGVNSRLAKNAQKLARCPLAVEKGQDNRRDILHPARFMGGASCALTDQWSAARKVIGEGGVIPLGNYDLDAVGCGGSVTPKGWLELHNPASQDLRLKWFHLPNVANSNHTSKKQEGDDGCDSVKEIVDLDSFRMALNTAREALASALPWNRSISAIIGLMLNTSYLQEDLGGNPKRAAILTEFVDYIFSRNALNWENSQPFLTTDELAHVWGNWRSKRGISNKSTEKSKKEKEGDGKKKFKADICRLYNMKTCASQTDKECKTPWGRTLRHVCNKFMAGGKICQKEHSRMDHT